MIPPETAMPFDPAEFCKTVEVGSAIAKKLPPPTPQEMMEARCSDPEMVNFGVAVGRRFKDDRAQFDSFMWRWKAWSQWLLSGELRRLYPTHDAEHVAECAMEVAAVCSLTKDGELERQTFLGALAGKLGKN